MTRKEGNVEQLTIKLTHYLGSDEEAFFVAIVVMLMWVNIASLVSCTVNCTNNIFEWVFSPYC